MAYISSNANRWYCAREASYGQIPPITAEHRIPAVSLAVQQQREKSQRRDKTGSRTWTGAPAGLFLTPVVIWSFQVDNKVKATTNDRWTDIDFTLRGLDQLPTGRPPFAVFSQQKTTGRMRIDAATCEKLGCEDWSLPGFTLERLPMEER